MTVFLAVLCAAAVMMACEAAVPGRRWPAVRNWWLRAALLNGIQAGAVFLAGAGWNGWMVRHRPWSLDTLGATSGALLGYFALTFVFYWWHRARHESSLLWRLFHQIHHSAQRIEIVTSFYKHPCEILANGLISGVILYWVVGLGPEAASGAVLLSGLAELVYHWNVSTPHWLGYVFQRPESHCLHHQEGVHAFNYSDLPVWDMLFGTFRNPRRFSSRCGLGSDAEHRLGDMLRGVDLNRMLEGSSFLRPYAPRLLLVLGLSQMVGDALQILPLRAIGAATAASPAPKVFSAIRGLEPFSTRFVLEWREHDGVQRSLELTPDVYRQLRGPYNRRNIYGAVLAGAPILSTDIRMQPLFRSVAAYALCGNAPVLRELGVDPSRLEGPPGLRYEPRPGSRPTGLPLSIEAPCS